MKMKSSLIRILPVLGALAAGDLFAEIQIYAKAGDPAPSTQKVFYFSRQNNSHHRPASFLSSVRQEFGERGIQFTTSTDRNDLNLDNLNQYDGTFFFGNHDAFTAAQTAALETYLQDGGGMVGMHVIAYVARSNATLARILGGAFLGHHSISSFTAQLIQDPNSLPQNLANHPNYPFEGGETYAFNPNHPILDGLVAYTSPDEPYLHQSMNPDITLLSYREDHGGWDEPYTWIRHEGNGRVFYHANGHDSRTWSQPNFRELMIRGISWASKTPQQSYTEFIPPVISTSGAMQYLAMVQTDNRTPLALHGDNFQTAMSGLQLPGSDETLSYLVSSSTAHAILANDKVVLAPKALSGSDELACLLIGHQQYPSVVAMENGPADSLESGFTFSPNQTFPFVTDFHDSVVFSASIEDSAGGNQKRVVALHNGDSLRSILTEGDPLGSENFPVVSSIADRTMICSGTTKLAIIAEISTEEGLPQEVILIGTPENLSPHIFANQIYEGLPQDSVISDFITPVSLQKDQLTFSGRLTGESVDQSNDQFVATISHDGDIDLIIRENDLIEGLNLSLTLDLLPPVPRDNDHLLLGFLGDDLTLISSKLGRSPVVLVRENQSLVVNGQNYLITRLDSGSLIGTGNQAVMVATLKEADSTIEVSVLLQIGSGTIRPLVIEGHQIDHADEPFTISAMSCHPSSSHGSGLSNNELRLQASSLEGASAIIGISNIDDLDQDGLSDTLESAFGNSILENDASLPPGYPKMAFDETGHLYLTFWEPIAAGPGLEYRIETSNDMKVWRTISLEVVLSSDQTNIPKNYRRMMAGIQNEDGTRFYRFAF